MELECKENETATTTTTTTTTTMKMEQTAYEGSDSGVEMSGRCYHCRSSAVEVDSETDSCQIDSSNGHSPLVYNGGGDVSELVSSTIRQLCVRAGVDLNGGGVGVGVGVIGGGGEHCSHTAYDAASENGSESSSIDETKKCKSNCVNGLKLGSYCASRGSRRQTTPSSRSRSSPFASDALKFATSKPSSSVSSSSSSKCDSFMAADTTSCAATASSPTSLTLPSSTAGNKTKLPIAETKNRASLRSCSVTRSRTPVGSPDELKWPIETRLSGSKLLPGGSGGGCSSDRTTFDTYATLPRRKQRELSDSRNGVAPRDPSLNRAASLRKKFLENSLMTTSLNASIGSVSSTKTLPPYVKSKPVKTKIYHEVASQTSLTNKDVDEALSSQPFSVYNDMEIQAEAEYRIKKRYEEQMRAINDELKRLKKENGKQRTVIEWLEGELTAAKDEKCALKNKYSSIEERIYSLLRHRGSCDDVFHQLEHEVSDTNNIISKQQDEIAELHQVVCMLKRDLEKSYSTQRTIVETQKANEMESLELQEFLQAEKVTLTDTLKDMEQELTLCRTRLTQKEQELANKQKEYENLEQIRQEKQTLKMCLCNLERQCRELLLHQGSVISSASVALSGLGSRFDELLEQLVTAYNISDDELLRDEFRLTGDSANKSNGECHDENERSITADDRCGSANSSLPWLKAISSILSRTSSTEKQDCNGGAGHQLENSASGSSILDLKTTTNGHGMDSNAVGSDDPFCLVGRLDSRRNSLLSDVVYLADENLALDAGVHDTNFLKDYYPSRDVSLVEQVIEVDRQVTKVLKAMLISGERFASVSATDSPLLTESANPYKKQNGVHVPESGSAIAFLRLQQKTVNNLLSVLHQMQDAVDGSSILKKIQNDLEDVDRKCSTFLAPVPFDTAV